MGVNERDQSQFGWKLVLLRLAAAALSATKSTANQQHSEANTVSNGKFTSARVIDRIDVREDWKQSKLILNKIGIEILNLN